MTPQQASRFNPIYVEPGSTQINYTKDLQTLYPKSFDRIGDMFGEYDIKIDPQVPPVKHGRHKVPIKYKAEIEKELDGPSGNHNETNGADTMGQLTDVPKETKQQAQNLSRSQRSQQGHNQRKPQGTNTGRNSSHTDGRNEVLKGGQKQSIFWNAPNWASIAAYNVQHASW